MTGVNARLQVGDTRLVALAPHHLPALRQVELEESLAFRWRHHGSHPSPVDFESSLWAGALCHFLVLDSREDPVGLVSAYDADMANGHCRVAAASFRGKASGTRIITGMFLLLDYVFFGWPMRKVYLESLAFNVPQFQSVVGSLMREEGRLEQHSFLGGSYHDLLVLAIYREDWEPYALRWMSSRGRDDR